MSRHDYCEFNCGATDCMAPQLEYMSEFDKLCLEFESENPEQWEEARKWARKVIARMKIELQPFY